MVSYSCFAPLIAGEARYETSIETARCSARDPFDGLLCARAIRKSRGGRGFEIRHDGVGVPIREAERRETRCHLRLQRQFFDANSEWCALRPVFFRLLRISQTI